ncbi:hypothetical protein ACIRF8_31385 [Streptomyces sp. NPDC102406]|uniref:hypothetical protein n=1 Tax=Streptomyces sp. NPDC102406 TaxID=3366171 RepID=UPI0037FE0955
MSAHADGPQVPTDPAFLAWARDLCEDLWLMLGEIDPSNDFLAFLWQTFTTNGEAPSSRIAPLIQQRRIELARHYMHHFVAQARQDTGLTIEEAMSFSEPDELEPTGLTQVGNLSIQGIHRADVARDTAEAVQDYLMARYWMVWPQCPTHHLGLHPVLTDGIPQWKCSSGDHNRPMLRNDA